MSVGRRTTPNKRLAIKVFEQGGSHPSRSTRHTNLWTRRFSPIPINSPHESLNKAVLTNPDQLATRISEQGGFHPSRSTRHTHLGNNNHWRGPSCYWAIRARSAVYCVWNVARFDLVRESLAVQWGAADAEIKVPSDENTELKRSLFKAWSR